MNTSLAIAEIIVGAILITLILLQQRDSDMSGFLGGGSGGSGVYQQRRGVERFFFGATIVLTLVFATLALVSHLYETPVTTPVQELPAASSTPATE